MKKALSIAIIAMIVAAAPLISCKKAAFVSDEEKLLPLEAPSGQRIAGTIYDLKKEASTHIATKFGAKKDFELTGIEYLPVTKGYGAIISYQLSDGTTGNFANVAGVGFNIASSSISGNLEKITRLPDGSLIAGGASSSKVTISCEKTGTCDCRIITVVNAQSGVVTYKCSCEHCQITIVIS